MLEEVTPYIQDVEELMTQLEALKVCYNKAMNRLEVCKKCLDHTSNVYTEPFFQ